MPKINMPRINMKLKLNRTQIAIAIAIAIVTALALYFVPWLLFLLFAAAVAVGIMVYAGMIDVNQLIDKSVEWRKWVDHRNEQMKTAYNRVQQMRAKPTTGPAATPATAPVVPPVVSPTAPPAPKRTRTRRPKTGGGGSAAGTP